MPWKQWAYLERVTSPDFQSYLQNQTVPTFTNVAQRDSVYTPVPPPTGALCVTTDTLTVWKWNGSAWKPATTRSAARQQVLGTYDAAAPVNIYTAQIAATTDANGYVIVTPASIGMPVLTGVLNVIAQVVNTPWYCSWYQSSSSLTSLVVRVFAGGGAPIASQAATTNIVVWYQ
ncbi:MAG TPA: hypothetical protein VFF43_08420 [Caldimonas sp.]|nr:hypothetical protein [Caldimonas sp.]